MARGHCFCCLFYCTLRGLQATHVRPYKSCYIAPLYTGYIVLLLLKFEINLSLSSYKIICMKYQLLQLAILKLVFPEFFENLNFCFPLLKVCNANHIAFTWHMWSCDWPCPKLKEIWSFKLQDVNLLENSCFIFQKLYLTWVYVILNGDFENVLFFSHYFLFFA